MSFIEQLADRTRSERSARSRARLGREAVQAGVCTGVYDAGPDRRVARVRLSNGLRVSVPVPAGVRAGDVLEVRGALGRGDEGTPRMLQLA